MIGIYDRYNWLNGWTKLDDIFLGNPYGTPWLTEAKKIEICFPNFFLFHGQRRALQLVYIILEMSRGSGRELNILKLYISEEFKTGKIEKMAIL